MPEWSQNAPTVPTAFTFRLIRVPANKPIRCVILSPHPIGCRTHFFKGHTMPCEEEKCEACQQGIYWRWHAYLPCLCLPAGEKIVLELTAQAFEQLSPALSEYRTLRGIEILAERPSRRPNGRIRIAYAPGLRPESSMPEAPDVALTMQHIWGLDDKVLAKIPAKLGVNRVFPTGGNGKDLTQNIGTQPD